MKRTIGLYALYLLVCLGLVVLGYVACDEADIMSFQVLSLGIVLPAVGFFVALIEGIHNPSPVKWAAVLVAWGMGMLCHVLSFNVRLLLMDAGPGYISPLIGVPALAAALLGMILGCIIRRSNMKKEER